MTAIKGADSRVSLAKLSNVNPLQTRAYRAAQTLVTAGDLIVNIGKGKRILKPSCDRCAIGDRVQEDAGVFQPWQIEIACKILDQLLD
jgi:hypothetical protein